MMAHSKLFAAILLALFTIALEPAAGTDWLEIGYKLETKWNERSMPAKPTAEQAYSFAELYLELLEDEGEEGAHELLEAWYQVLHEPDLCDELSFEYIAIISKCSPQYKHSMDSLYEATKKYASNCLKPTYIEDEIELQASVYSSQRRSNDIAEFIDDQFIADYWSEHPGERKMEEIRGTNVTMAIAKAIIRHGDIDVKNLKFAQQVHDHLYERLYKPCYEYWRSFGLLRDDIYYASDFWKGGYEKLISALDYKSQDMIFRYELCSDENIQHETYAASKQIGSYAASEQIAFNLNRLTRI